MNFSFSTIKIQRPLIYSLSECSLSSLFSTQEVSLYETITTIPVPHFTMPLERLDYSVYYHLKKLFPLNKFSAAV